MSDTEVITREIVRAVLGYAGDEAIWEYCRRYWLPWCPGLGGRPTGRRQAATVGRVNPGWHPRWVAELGAATADGAIIDGVPIPVCQLVRAPRSRVVTAAADDGYWAAKQHYYYGLTGHLLIERRGVVTGITVTAAPVAEGDAAYDVLTAIDGILRGDKGDIRPHFNVECDARGIDLQPPGRRNLTEPRPQWGWRLRRRLRKRIETVISHREPPFGLARRRARDAWHLTTRVTRARLAHTVAVAVTLRLGRSPLDLDNLLVN